jgi:hypothetical protein
MALFKNIMMKSIIIKKPFANIILKIEFAFLFQK